MGYSSLSGGGFVADNHKKVWDPYTDLEFCNPARGAFTCVGYAPTQGRRCRNPIAIHNRTAVCGMLDRIASKSPTSSDVAALLPEIAELSLCVRYHQDQVDKTVRKWELKVKSIKIAKSEPSRSLHEQFEISTDASERSDGSASLLGRLGKLVDELKQKNEHLSKEVKDLKRHKEALESQNCQVQSEKAELMKEMRVFELDKKLFAIQKSMLESEVRTIKQERDDLKQKVQEQMNKDKQEGEREDSTTKEREENTQENELRDRERQRNEQEKRDRDERIERIRLAAQKKREERERQARESAEKEKREWEAAWERYIDSWVAFKKKDSASESKSRQMPPWPVKSGLYSDVEPSNVQAFFDKACPDRQSSAMMLKAMTNEALRWHPDKILVLIESYTPAEKTVAEMICRVVLDLRKGAKEKLGEGEAQK